MRRLIALIVLFVFGSVAYADYEMSDSQKQKYRDWLRSLDTFYTGALAIAPNGCWYADGGGTRSQAKRAALKSCKKHCKSDACKVVDVNGTSAFIKQRGSSSSSSTASSRKIIWCVTSFKFNNKYIHQKTRAGCAGMAGKVFASESLAEAEHQRLKGTATASSKKKVWCATKYASWSSVKGCRSGVNAFQTETQARAEHQRLKGTTTTSSSKKLIWCATASSVLKVKELACRYII